MDLVENIFDLGINFLEAFEPSTEQCPFIQ